MSQLVLQAGQTFTSSADQLGATETATQNSDGTLTVTKDQNASSAEFVSITINGVHPNQTVSVNYGGTTENVVTTTYDVTIDTIFGATNVTGDLLGTDGTNVLIGSSSFPGGSLIVSSGPQSFGTISDTFTPAFTVACFAQGTLIRTDHGDVPVERLQPGDRVVSAFGGHVPIAWLGLRHVRCARHGRPEDVQPIRVRAGACSENLPERDLLLSPDHALYFAEAGAVGVLIPVRHLVNGRTILQEPVAEVTYWHVELPAHDVLLANGLPAESYLDTGNRCAFANGGQVALAEPDFALRVWQAESCAKLVQFGPELAQVRARLLARARTLGHAQTTDADLQLILDGTAIPGRRTESGWAFSLPAGVRDVVLCSRAEVPGHMLAQADDVRRLGVAVTSLHIDGVAAPPSSFGPGWHAAEAGWRWTDGAAVLHCPGAAEIEIGTLPMGRYWCDAPQAASRAA